MRFTRRCAAPYPTASLPRGARCSFRSWLPHDRVSPRRRSWANGVVRVPHSHSHSHLATFCPLGATWLTATPITVNLPNCCPIWSIFLLKIFCLRRNGLVPWLRWEWEPLNRMLGRRSIRFNRGPGQWLTWSERSGRVPDSEFVDVRSQGCGHDSVLTTRAGWHEVTWHCPGSRSNAVAARGQRWTPLEAEQIRIDRSRSQMTAATGT